MSAEADLHRILRQLKTELAWAQKVGVEVVAAVPTPVEEPEAPAEFQPLPVEAGRPAPPEVQAAESAEAAVEEAPPPAFEPDPDELSEQPTQRRGVPPDMAVRRASYDPERSWEKYLPPEDPSGERPVRSSPDNGPLEAGGAPPPQKAPEASSEPRGPTERRADGPPEPPTPVRAPSGERRGPPRERPSEGSERPPERRGPDPRASERPPERGGWDERGSERRGSDERGSERRGPPERRGPDGAPAGRAVATPRRGPSEGARPARGRPEPGRPRASGALPDDGPRLQQARGLEQVREVLGNCERCKLHGMGRRQIVFGVGNPQARVMFVGEGPGAQEDRQGEPFVGDAGQLLTDIIQKGMKMPREQVYIANIVKCRPPGNRDPEPDEVEQCEPFLAAQIRQVRPEVIVALGRYAAQALLKTNTSISRLRGRWQTYMGIDLMPTFHPAYVLRNLDAKRPVWEDIKQVIARLENPPR